MMTKVCAFSPKKVLFDVAPRFQHISLFISASIGMLGVKISNEGYPCCSHPGFLKRVVSRDLGPYSRINFIHLDDVTSSRMIPMQNYGNHPRFDVIPCTYEIFPRTSSYLKGIRDNAQNA